MKLNDKQEAFCIAYAETKNATQAAIKAGYSENGARQKGFDLLTKVDIQKRLSELAEEVRAEKESEYHGHILNAAEMQGKLSEIISRQLEDYTVVSENGTPKLIATPAQLKDIVSAIDKLARMQGAYNDRIAVSGSVPIVICGEGTMQE